jgi:transposase
LLLLVESRNFNITSKNRVKPSGFFIFAAIFLKNMKSKLILLLGLVIAYTSFAQNDTIISRDNNVLNGEIKDMDRGVLTLETSYSDSDFKIEWLDFTGNKAELGGRGDSKEKRHDRFIVTYGLVTNQDNMPLDIKIWKGGTADSKTVLKTFSEWKAYYNTTKAIWVADRSMSGEPTIDEIKQLGLNYITGLPGQAQRALLMIEHGSQPELFDQQGIASINHNGGRYILCRHQSKGYRKEIQAARHRRKIFEQLKKIQNSPQNKDNKKIYHRAMKVIEKYEQTGLWKIWVESVEIKQQQRFRLMFRLDRKASVVHDKIGHYYLLQTDLDQESMNNQMVVDSYQDLIKVERSFRDLKTHIEIRPMRHWRERRIKSHIFLCFLSLWLNKYIKKCWLNQGIKSEVTPKLIQWDLDLCLCEKVNSKGSMIETKDKNDYIRSKIPDHSNGWRKILWQH